MVLIRSGAMLIVGAVSAVVVGCGGEAAGPAAPVVDTAPLLYSPTWLPAGLTERIRGHSDGPPNRIRRGWARPNDTVEPVNWNAPLTIAVSGPGCSIPTYATAVDITGRPGRFAVVERPSGARSAILCWEPDDRTSITVTDDSLGLDQATVQRIAESVRPDRAATRQPLRVPEEAHTWIGMGTPQQSTTVVGTSATDWTARYHVDGVAKGDKRYLTVTAARSTPAPDGGEAVPVGERSGRFVTRATPGVATTAFLVVDLGAGLLLTVEAWSAVDAGGASAGVDPLRRIALETRFDGAPLAWIGSRPG
jgi:hypothetical protein